MIDVHLVKSKLHDIEKYYGEMSPLLAVDSRELIEDSVRLHALERLFQLIVDRALDVNTHVIAESNFSAPDDYQSTFITLGEHKVIPMDFALTIAPSVGLRNRVVHKYGNVDLKRMVDEIKENIGQYLEYLRLTVQYISSLEK